RQLAAKNEPQRRRTSHQNSFSQLRQDHAMDFAIQILRQLEVLRRCKMIDFLLAHHDRPGMEFRVVGKSCPPGRPEGARDRPGHYTSPSTLWVSPGKTAW